jgi:hypothetical protein
MHPKYWIKSGHASSHVPRSASIKVNAIMDTFERAIIMFACSNLTISRKVFVLRVSSTVPVGIHKHVLDICEIASSCFLDGTVHFSHGVRKLLRVFAAGVAPGLSSVRLILLSCQPRPELIIYTNEKPT